MIAEQAKYLQAIATLAAKLQASRIHKKVNLSRIIESEMLWDLVAEEIPEVKILACEVEKGLNCELTYEQCCNAVGWLHNYHPSEWQKYLSENLANEAL